MKHLLSILIIPLIIFPSRVSAQDTISRSLTLPEATVTAEKVTCFYSKPSFTMFDFEILDDNFFILQKKSGLKNDYRVLITDMLYNPIDTILLPQHIVPQQIILDCMNYCQIMGQDSVYQILKYENDYAIAFPCEKNRYQIIMGNILFITSKYLYINESKLQGYVSTFYRYDLETKEKENLFVCDDTRSVREIKQDVKFHQWYKTDSPDYWHYTIYQDRVSGSFYTVLGTTLHEINVQTGKTTPKIHVNNFLSDKIIIYKGNLYSLKKKRDSSSSEISYIEKTNLY